MRNAYLLVDFGDFVDGTTNTTNPYIQLLSTTNDSTNAHQDFVKVRLSGGSNGSTTSDNKTSSSPISSKIRKILVIAGGIGLAILGLLAALCFCCFRKRSGRAAAPTMGYGGPTYRPLEEPAPNAAVETHAMPNLNYNTGPYTQGPPAYGGEQPYDPRYDNQPQYQTAWDHRY